MPDQVPQTQSDLASFGEELRREREIRGISLKEIADATKISKRFLEALEGNDHRTLPAPVFTRGFVREYARYLGLSVDEMVTRYNVAAAGDDRIEKSAHLERLIQPPVIEGDRSRRPASEHSTGRRYINAIALLIVGAGLAAIAWWAVEQKRERAHAETSTPPIVSPHVPKPIVPPVQAPPPEPEPLKLTIELTDDSWIDLQVDGQTVMRDDYRAGTRDAFDAKNNFTFKRIGDAAAVTLMLNGRQLPPLGRPGRVIKNLVLDRPYLEKLNATQ